MTYKYFNRHVLCISRHSHCISATTQLSGSIRFFFLNSVNLSKHFVSFCRNFESFHFSLRPITSIAFFISKLFAVLLLRAIYSAGFCQFCLSVSSSLFNMIIANALIGLNRMIWVFCTSLLICSSQFWTDYSEITGCAQKFGMH